jgi:hypothetical protein
MGMIPSTRSWESDPATEKQLGLIRKHNVVPPSELRNLTKGQASALIDRIKTSEPKGSPSELATEPQVRLIRTLCEEVGEPVPNFENLTKTNASIVITNLKIAGLATKPLVDEGLYILDSDVYKVKKSQETGNLYAVKLTLLAEPEYVSNGVRTHKFMHAPRVVNRLRPEHTMTKEQAVEFGQRTSTCVRCGTKLEETITQKDGSPRWIGPECQKKMGW